MNRAIEFYCRLSKRASNTDKLMKAAFKDKCSGESTIFRWHGNFKNLSLSTELDPKPGRPESMVND